MMTDFSRSVAIAILLAVSPGAFAQDATALGASVEPMIDAGRHLSPRLRAAALETASMAAKAEGADALDDPMISDSYQYYRDPGVFSGHAIMVTQAFPLWGKRDLRRDAALADLAAARGREQAARDELDERIKVAFARYYVASHAIEINQDSIKLIEGMRRAATARYGAGRGDQGATLLALTEETAARTDMERLQGDREAAMAQINALIARAPDEALAAPDLLRRLPTEDAAVSTLIDRARGDSPALASDSAEIDSARARQTLADKAWYPDVTIGAGPLIQTNNRSPGISATIGINIPLGWGREASEQKAAAAQLGAAQERFSAALFDLQAALGDAVARLNAARRTTDLLGREAIPDARALIQSVLADYAQGRGDLLAAMAAQHRLHDLEFKLLQAKLDGQTALAAIERLIGGEL